MKKKQFYSAEIQEDQHRGGIRRILAKEESRAADPLPGQLSVFDVLGEKKPQKEDNVSVPVHVYVPKKHEYRTVNKQLKIDPAVFEKAEKEAQAAGISVNEYLNRILIAAVNALDVDMNREKQPGIKKRRFMMMLTPSLCKAAEEAAKRYEVSFNEMVCWAAEFPERLK